ncbi:MAG: glycoside hydrolase family 13 protein [Candidatus Hydrogenedentota bacterium]
MNSKPQSSLTNRASGRVFRPGRELVYQIFPDRWKNARPDRNPADGSWNWKKEPVRFTTDHSLLTGQRTDQYHFFGGDLEGVRESLPYLQDLGVTAVYMTPIFQARSTHRYDAVDYMTIDPALGTREDFEALAGDLRKRKMKLVLDGVLNHTSEEHPWHTDPDMRKEHYIMKADGQPMSWLNHGSLPKLDPQNPQVAKKLLEVLDAWPEADLWRLDAAHLLPQEFLRQLRSHVAPRPILIEDWSYCPHYFRKNIADAVTNFLFRDAVRTFFIQDASPETLLERLEIWIRTYPRRNLGLSWNFLDNHDTERFISLAGRDSLMRALVLLFTLPGTPMLYHGCEVGMKGKTTGESRAPMEWDESKWDRGIFDHVKSLAKLRREHPVLATGGFTPLFADNRSRAFAFERTDRASRAVIALNDGYLPGCFHDQGTDWTLDPGSWRIEITEKHHPVTVLVFSA